MRRKTFHIKKHGNPSTRSTRQIKAQEHKSQKNITMKTPQLYTNKRGDHKLLRTCCVAHTCLFMFISMFRVMNDWMKTKKDFGDWRRFLLTIFLLLVNKKVYPHFHTSFAWWCFPSQLWRTLGWPAYVHRPT